MEESPDLRALVANVDAALVSQAIDVAQRKREADKHHYRQADDLGGRFEVTEGAGAFIRRSSLDALSISTNYFSDSASLPSYAAATTIPE